MEKDFLAMGSGVIRHDLVNALFVVQVLFEQVESDCPPEKAEKIKVEIEKAFSIIDIWKELDASGDAPVWQDLRTVLLKGARNADAFVSVEVGSFQIQTNGLFHFIFSNLIDNSIRHGRKEDIKIKISSRIEEGNLVIVYQDNGVGVPEEHKKRIFYHGFGKHTGLGMFFTKKIVENMDASIVENGTPGRGARFEIRIPEDVYRMSNGDL